MRLAGMQRREFGVNYGPTDNLDGVRHVSDPGLTPV